MEYKIKKAPEEYLHSQPRGQKRTKFPITELEVGQMFEAHPSSRTGIYNAIKHRRNYTKEIAGRVFTIKTISEDKIAVIRLK